MLFAWPRSRWYAVRAIWARGTDTFAPSWGGLKAVKAMARVLACLYYRLVKQGQVWLDRGTVEFEQRRQQRDLATLQRKARSLGMQLVPTT
jgi:hypothetical protein